MTRELTFRCWAKHLKIFAYFTLRRLARDPKMQKIVEDANTVYQATGFKDKKGVEIYEGDIVYHKGCSPKEYKLIVVWKNYRWKFERVEDRNCGHPISQLYNHPENFELLGNIYENKELLTTNKK